MKKKFFAALLAMAMVLVMVPFAMANDASTTPSSSSTGTYESDDAAVTGGYVARIGEEGTSATYFTTLSAAVESVHTKTSDDRMAGTEITLLTNVTRGEGIAVGYSNFDVDKGSTTGNSPVKITIDLGGHTYRVSNRLVGSTGTETNGFQLLENSNVTLKNGTISAGNRNIYLLIQNYSDLKLENVTLDKSYPGWGVCYTLSNNSGDITITGDTNIIAPSRGYAFDICKFQNYESVSVTFDENFTGTVTGTILYDVSSTDNASTHTLKIEGTKGSFGTIATSNANSATAAQTAIDIVGGTFSAPVPVTYCAGGSVPLVQDADGNCTVVASTSDELAGKIEANDGTYYADTDAAEAFNEASVTTTTASGDSTIKYCDTLAAAVSAVESAAAEEGTTYTIDLLDDVTISGSQGNTHGVLTITKDVTINGHEHSITANVVTNNTSMINIQGGADVTISDLTIDSDHQGKHGLNINDAGTVTLNNVTIKNGTATAVTNNTSVVIANGLYTEGNAWGAVNVDQDGTFTFNNGNLTEDSQIWSEDADEPNGSTITANGYDMVTVNKWDSDNSTADVKTHYTTHVEKLGEASITVTDDDGNQTTTVYDTVERALDAAESSTEETNGSKHVTVISDATLDNGDTIDEGVTLTVDSGVTLTIPTDQELENNGVLNSNGTVNGTVTTGEEGTTVAAVTFVVSPTTATVTINGSTLRSNESIKLAPGTYPYTVTASGYQTASGSVTVDNAAQTHTINLLPMPADPTYNVTITRPVNGAVTASATSGVRPGSTVTLTVTPDRGYALSALTIRGSGASVPYSSLGNGRYSFVMPEGGVTVSAVFTRIRFTDVPTGEWYYDAVYWAVENGVTDGTSDTLFSPGRDVTRAEMVTFLWRAAGCPEPTTTVNPFEDVSSSAYYYDAVLWAVEEGITDGVSDTEFDPDGECTRAQMVTFLWRAENEPDVGTSNPFEDVDEEEYYYEAILWAAANGITDGMTDTTFVPDGNCTRAQAVTFLYRTMV